VDSDIQIWFSFLPEVIRRSLVAEIANSRDRKQEFNLYTNSVPTSVTDATAFASSKLRLTFNVAILKRYSVHEPSGAYNVHTDPENLWGIPLVLCTLRGQADLFVYSEANGMTSIRCVENMLVVLRPEMQHRITPPLGTDRHLLFLGFEEAYKYLP